MTKINLHTTQDAPANFEPQQGQVFQVEECRETVLVMVGDDTETAVILTGSSAGYIMAIETLDANLSRENLVSELHVTATLNAL